MEPISKSCEFFSEGSCLLGYHSGRPHSGNCEACIKHGENKKEFAQRIKTPQQILNFGRAVTKFSSSGFALIDGDQLEIRLAVCMECPFWEKNGFFGSGRCNKCGCSTQAKLRMATEKCPIGKW